MSFRRALLAAAALLAASSCSRAPQPPLVRLAILRFENLSPAAAPDWAGRALSDIVTSSLTGAPHIYAIPTTRLHQFNGPMGARPVSVPGISAEAPLAAAAGADRIGYGTYAVVGGRLRVRLTIEDAASHRAADGPIEVSVGEGDVLGAGAALAKAISSGAQPYGTSSEAALEAYARAIEAPPAGMAADAERAIAADPGFGKPYLVLAEIRAQQQGRAGAEPVVQAALARAAAMPPIDRVRLLMLDATLRGDSGALERALGEFVKVAPLDPAAWRATAQFQAGSHRWGPAVQAYQRSLELEPEDATSWNELAYTAAYGGNFEVARAATARYQQLRPSEANPIDTRGDIEIMAGRLGEAERLYLEAAKKDPQFLGGADIFKAAMARLMTGDVAGADGLLQQGGAAALASGPEWLWLSGRRSQAFAALSAQVPKLPQDAQARAYTHLALWALLLGDRPGAGRAAQQAGSTATQATAAIVAVARFITQPSAVAAEWSARAARMFPNAPPNSIKDYALGYALLLDRHFEAAAPILAALEAHTPANGDRGAAIDLAWALVELGRWKDAAPLLALNPVPNIGATSVFVPLYFPRLFELRADVAEREGKTAEARENRRIFAALSGK